MSYNYIIIDSLYLLPPNNRSIVPAALLKPPSFPGIPGNNLPHLLASFAAPRLHPRASGVSLSLPPAPLPPLASWHTPCPPLLARPLPPLASRRPHCKFNTDLDTLFEMAPCVVAKLICKKRRS